MVLCYTITMKDTEEKVTFITGSAGKWEEVSAVLGDRVVQKDIDLPEIQDLDVKKVIAAKLIEARKVIPLGAILVDDSGYYFHAMGRLPGVFSKFFYEELGLEGNVALLEKFGDNHVTAYTLLGYMDERGVISNFEGVVEGTLVAPHGTNGFGFDPVFLPEGSQKTMAEMNDDERHSFKMRTIAVKKLKEFLGK